MARVPSTTVGAYHQKLVIRKGVLYDEDDPDYKLTLYSWDVVPFCQVTACPAFKYCDYNKSVNIRCPAQVTYMKHVVQILIFENPVIDNMLCFRIGSELIPLYSMLFTFYIEQVGLEKKFWEKNSKPYVHPVFKEIRETVKLIATLRQKIGIPDSLKINTNPKQLFTPGSSNNGHGNTEALKKMRRRR